LDDPRGKSVPPGVIVAYDSISGVKLFTEPNRAVRLLDQTDALPKANDCFEHSGKSYFIVGVRKGSTETLCGIDVREES